METSICFDHVQDFWIITISDCERINRNYHYLLISYQVKNGKPLLFPTNDPVKTISEIGSINQECFNFAATTDNCLKIPRLSNSLILINNYPDQPGYRFQGNKLITSEQDDMIVINSDVDVAVNYFL